MTTYRGNRPIVDTRTGLQIGIAHTHRQRNCSPIEHYGKHSAALTFIRVYRQYRQAHSIGYAARIAWGVAFRNLPF